MTEFIKVYPVETHQKNFDKLMTMIEFCVERGSRQYGGMTHTDYNMKDVERPYKALFREMIRPYIDDYMKIFGCFELKECNAWYAQYYDGGDFGWHAHTGANLSCVYLLEGTPESATKFWGIDVKINEGDLVIFPAMIAHKSPHVNHGRKTMIAQNMDIC